MYYTVYEKKKYYLVDHNTGLSFIQTDFHGLGIYLGLITLIYVLVFG